MRNFMQKLGGRLRRRAFEAITGNRLVYNTCWEDPRVDRGLLEIGPRSRVLALTGAGCNVLDYLLDDPGRIECVDANPAQNALLQLKVALLEKGEHDLLWDFFGEGGTPSAPHRYRREIREGLPAPAVRYWDRHIDYFRGDAGRCSFYFRGTAGRVAWLFHRRIRVKGLGGAVRRMLNASTLAEQRNYFREIEPRLWNAFYRWLIRRSGTLAMLGVPRSQRRMIEEKGGLLPFIRGSLEQVFTQLPLSDNYFWRVYLTGSYARNCCPNYLRGEHFETLRNRTGRLRVHTASLNNHLADGSGKYSHFVLLDHMDWMAGRRPEKLRELWLRILKRARPGAKVLFRSADPDAGFLPGFVRERLRLQRMTRPVTRLGDRVGTYAGTHLGTVRS